jgi:Mn-dependent DtxR family transcriptional regulator
MSKAGLSESIQDYLKSVYKLEAEHGRVTIGALAKDKSVSPASESAMVKKLAALDLLEHVISEELEARIDRALGFPTHDPHGDPIPDANLEWPREGA